MNHICEENSYDILKQTIRYFCVFLAVSYFSTLQLFAQGPTLDWVKRIGGADNQYGHEVAVDLNGNLVTTGIFYDTVDFDPGAGTTFLASNGSVDVFVQKMDANGNFLWAKSFGGFSLDETHAVTTDSFGNVIVVGNFYGTVDFNPGAGVFNITTNGQKDVFVLKLDPNGNFLWVKTFGGTVNEEAWGVVTDANDNIYTTGWFMSNVDFDPGVGTMNVSPMGLSDCFIQKLDGGGGFIWAKIISGQSSEIICDMTFDQSGNLCTTGFFWDTADLDPGPGVVSFTSNGLRDAFVLKMDVNGNYIWAKSFGSGGSDTGYQITTDPIGDIYLIGTFENAVDFDPGPGMSILTSNGDHDVYIQRLDSMGNLIWAKAFGGTDVDHGIGITLNTNGHIFATGDVQDVVDFDPGAGVINLTSSGVRDAFLIELNEDGTFVWAELFGGIDQDAGVSISSGPNGSIYTTGFFQDTVDFEPGVGTTNLTSAGGYDIFIQKLAVCLPSVHTDVQTACDSYTWIDGNTYMSSNSSATHTLTNTAGCDSIITLNLTINSVSTVGVTELDSTLTADLAPAPGTTYNWLDCDNGFVPVGVTTQSFTPTANGNYAVQIGEDECLDTSACFLIDDVGLDDFELNSMSVIPNPTSGLVTIEFESVNAELVILDLNGRLIEELTVSSGAQIDLSTYEKGVYLFKLQMDSLILTRRVVKD